MALTRLIINALTGRFAGLLIAAVLLGASSGLSAKAEIIAKTKYKYYPISGKSAQQLYRQMVRRGPHVAGSPAVAATFAKHAYTGELVAGKSSCRIRNLKIRIMFTMSLPRLKSGKSLALQTRRQWKQFAQFVKTHEQKHRSIWMGCAKRADRAMKRIRTSNCNIANSKAEVAFLKERVRCKRLHDRFDSRERARLARQPLIIAANNRQKRALKISKKPIRKQIRKPRRRIKTNWTTAKK